MLRGEGWYVRNIHGSQFQAGLPDLFAAHPKGPGFPVPIQRWIEVKDPNRKGNIFTSAQRAEFPKLAAADVGIYILTAATRTEYEKLFGPPNWLQFLQVMP